MKGKLGKFGVIFLALVLCLGAAGAGLAYFSSSEIVAVSSDAGTMDLQVAKDGGTNWWDGDTMTWSTPAAWAPGDTATLEVTMRNVGSSGAKMLKVGGESLGSTGGLVDVILITQFDATEYTPSDYMGIPISYWEGIFGDKSAPLTLREFVDSPYYGCFWEGGHPPTTDYLDPNPSDLKRVKLTLEFDPNAGNAYQGKTASFDLKVIVTDDTTILGEG